MGDENRSNGDTPEERRQAARAVTFRASCFTELTGEPRLCQGRVVDVSPSGFQMRSRSAPPVGSMLELEIAPRDEEPDHSPMVTRAKVVWSNPLSTGEVAMGLQNVDPKVLAEMVEGEGPDRSDYTNLAVGAAVAKAQEDLDYHNFREEAQDRLRHHRQVWPYMLSLLLLVLLLWMILGVVDRLNDEAAPPPPPGQEDLPELAPESEILPDGQGGPEQPVAADAVEQWLERGFALTALGQPKEAAELFLTLLASGVAQDGAAAAAMAGAATALAKAGLPAERLEAFAVYGGGAGTIPEPWRQRLAAMQESRGGGLRHQLVPAFTLATVPDAQQPGYGSVPQSGSVPHGGDHDDTTAVAPDGVADLPRAETPTLPHIEIALGEYVLRVYEGERLHAAFPIGTGGLELSPLGTFTIANRITDPDWYNRGTVVPAGDPENPLGSRWMGLARNGEAIPYGIHGTNEPASIGLPESRGCIRMYPSDIERLFGWCTPGTMVFIRP